MKEDDWHIYDSWNDKIVCYGDEEKCDKYLKENNVFGYNYSQLKIRKPYKTQVT